MNYIRCHGSGNRFLMLDAVRHPELEALGRFPQLVEAICCHEERVDGLLLTGFDGEHYGMRMFNTDGSEAEMCGNGIRCVARMAQEYVGEQEAFDLYSGGKLHGVMRLEPIFEQIPTYHILIGISLSSKDFTPSAELREGWINRPIEELDPQLRFTFLNLGNPHLVAEVKKIDIEQLERLGERVKELGELLPHGVNVSLFCHTADQEIYTATYERGVGLTSSCGTAMTACSTAACLMGLCRSGVPIRVRNKGGMVQCCCHRSEGEIKTSLAGNATYYAVGSLTLDLEAGCLVAMHDEKLLDEEIAQYERFFRSVQEPPRGA